MTSNCPSPHCNAVAAPHFFSEKHAVFQDVTAYIRPPSDEMPACISLIDLARLRQKLENGEKTSAETVRFLSPPEQKAFAQFTYIKRRTEWLGGRLAAKIALLRLHGALFSADAYADISILSAQNGAPALSWAEPRPSPEPALSISHSIDHVVALAARAKSCGIDIQPITGRTERLVERFAEPVEQERLADALPNLDEATRLTLLWSAKEAMKKSLLGDQPVIFQGVLLQQVTTGPDLTLRLEYRGKHLWRAEIKAFILGGSILAYTLAEQNHA